MSLFGTIFFSILQRCHRHVFLEQADEVCGGIEVQLDSDVGNRERGVLQLAAGLGQNLVEDVGLGRLAERLAHDFVQVVGRDAEAVGIELRAVLLAEVVTYELYEVIHIAAHGDVRQTALNGLHLLCIHLRHPLQKHHRFVEHGAQDVLVFLGIVCYLAAHLLIERVDAFKGSIVRHQERTATVCLQIRKTVEKVWIAEERQQKLLLKHQVQRIQLRIVLERPHLTRNGADNQPLFQPARFSVDGNHVRTFQHQCDAVEGLTEHECAPDVGHHLLIADDIHQQFIAILVLIEFIYKYFLHFCISARNYDFDLFTKKCSGVSWRYTSSIY